MIHELKIKPEYLAAIFFGDKTFEVRNNADRNFQVGDTLLLKAWDGEFTGDFVEKVVSYITDFEQKPGYVVLGLVNHREHELLEKFHRTGVAIERAISTGSVLADHPLRSRLELLANHRKLLIDKSELCDDLLDLVERMVNCMGLAGEEPEKDSYNPIKAWMYDAITTMAGQRQKPSVTITETIRTAPERIWLQVGDQSGDGDYPFPDHHDEVSWCADSVVACEVQYVRADLVGNIPAPVGGEMRTVTVSGKGLLELVEFACPDHETDVEQKETEIVLLNREAFTSTDGEKMPCGVYAYLAEYPEEGLYGPVGGTDPQGGDPCAIASPSSSPA